MNNSGYGFRPLGSKAMQVGNDMNCGCISGISKAHGNQLEHLKSQNQSDSNDEFDDATTQRYQ